MSHIHVCLVSDQPIPNMTTSLQFLPDEVALLYTLDKKRQSDRLEGALKSRGMRVSTFEIAPYDMGNVIGVCDTLLQLQHATSFSLNITGGTKIGTLATYQSFYSCGKPIYYVNTFDNQILQVSPIEQSFPIKVSIPITSYLALYGFKVESCTQNDHYLYRRKEATAFLADLAVRHPKLIGQLNSAFSDDVKKLHYPFTYHLPEGAEGGRLAELLEKCGTAKRSGSHTVLLPDIDSAQYLRGFWFEEYVYLAAKSIPGAEVKLNVVGKWETPRDVKPKNEFDVMVGAGNLLIYISCKTANADRKSGEEGIGREYLYELDALADNAIGLFGKKVLASARPVTDKYIRERAAGFNIELIDGHLIKELPSRIKKWLRL
jgi:hypothetical protein